MTVESVVVVVVGGVASIGVDRIDRQCGLELLQPVDLSLNAGEELHFLQWRLHFFPSTINPTVYSVRHPYVIKVVGC